MAAFNFNKDFWSQDRTTIHQKHDWFRNLPPLRKLTYGLLFTFVCVWSMFIGMNLSSALTPEQEINWIDRPSYEDEFDYSGYISDLEGLDVILLVGADKRPGETSYRTDTIILCFINWDTKDLSLLSIPRDSYVVYAGSGWYSKINGAYATGGIVRLQDTIEQTFGIRVDNYIEVDFEGFVKIIDALGGVVVDVEQRMYKYWEGIDLQPGVQLLDGRNSLGFVRFRDMVQGDIDRIANQQKFLQALAEQHLNASIITKLPSLISIGLENSNTNFSMAQLMSLGTTLLNTDFSALKVYSVPGRGLYIDGISYWVINSSEYMEMIMEITDGKMDGEPHIISDGGRGTTYLPSDNDGTEDEEGLEEEPLYDEEGNLIMPEPPEDGEGQENNNEEGEGQTEPPTTPEGTDPVTPPTDGGETTPPATEQPGGITEIPEPPEPGATTPPEPTDIPSTDEAVG